jgi:Rps23 Pro-64 3,4-dihydroxylase Tpa1-like proline 4-hydroxylase
MSQPLTTIQPFHFDAGQLSELAAAKRARYAGASPFPHIVFDDFLPESVVDDVVAEFPSPEGETWLRFESENERKLASRQDTQLGEVTRQLMAEFNSAAFVDFLAELTGISGLVADPHFEGGGLHQIVPGGHLAVHVDFNQHPVTRLDRRLNVLLYLNRDWEPEWGGALELWSRDMRRCEQRIEPLFNRLVVFSTTETSFHGHPTPLACPEDRTRRSLALYYYSRGRPEEGSSAQSTAHNTVWGKDYDPRLGRRERVKHAIRRVTPPILFDAARTLRERRTASRGG